MSVSPLSADLPAYSAFYPAGYQGPETNGLDRTFRLTAFSDMKGWGCKVPQETLLKLLQGLEPEAQPGQDGAGTGAGDEASEFGQLAPVSHGPRLGESSYTQSLWTYSASRYLANCSRRHKIVL